jgi:hypothetical protein
MFIRFVILACTPILAMIFGAIILNKLNLLINSKWIWSTLYLSTIFFAMAAIYIFNRKSPQLSSIIFGCVVGKMLLAFIFILVLNFFAKEGFLMLSLHFLFGFVCFSICELLFVKKLLQKVT